MELALFVCGFLVHRSLGNVLMVVGIVAFSPAYWGVRYVSYADDI